MEFVILERNTQERLLFYDPGSRLALGRDDEAEAHKVSRRKAKGPQSPPDKMDDVSLGIPPKGRRRTRRRPGLAKREPGSFQTQVSVFYDPMSAAHRAAHGMTLRRCGMRKAHSGPTTKCLLRRRTEKPLPGAVKRTWGAFHSASLRFWSIFPGFAHAMYAKTRVAVWTRRNSV